MHIGKGKIAATMLRTLDTHLLNVDGSMQKLLNVRLTNLRTVHASRRAHARQVSQLDMGAQSTRIEHMCSKYTRQKKCDAEVERVFIIHHSYRTILDLHS